MNRKHLMIYSAAHFWVDLSCAFLLFRALSGRPHFGEAVLLYNFFAFAMQLPLGMAADRFNRNSLAAAFGCLIIAAAYLLSSHPSLTITTAVIAGLGNALFHLGGGIDTLNHSEKKARALGIFVSPGAIGLYLGTVWGKSDSPALIIGAAGLIFCTALILLICRYPGQGFTSLNAQPDYTADYELSWLLLLFLVVVLRSFMGSVQTFPWKNEGNFGLLLVLALALGKAAGGFLSDRFGCKKTAVFSLTAAALLYLLKGYPLSGLLAVFLFNMTMPITLWAAAQILPKAKGVSFGLLTLGLFAGYLPAAFGFALSGNRFLLEAGLALASLRLLYPSLREVTR